MSKSYLRGLEKITKNVRQIKNKLGKIEKKYRNKAIKNFQKKFSLDSKLKTVGPFF